MIKTTLPFILGAFLLLIDSILHSYFLIGYCFSFIELAIHPTAEEVKAWLEKLLSY